VRFLNFSWAPSEATPVQRGNFLKVQIDAVGIGIAGAAAPFLPVFLTRLGATNFQVGLLTSMPAVTGLVLALVVGQFLQSRRRIVPWFSASRLAVISCYALTGLITFVVPREQLVLAVLIIWAVVTIPQTALTICFTVVMNAVAGPALRYDLLSRRWSIIGLTYALTVAAVGQTLDRIGFPLNYQLVFIGLSIGGLLSFYFSSRIELPDAQPAPRVTGLSPAQRVRGYFSLILGEREFVRFSIQRLVYVMGGTLALPLFPLYYVRDVQASDAWIGIINTVQTGLMLVGYVLWTRTSRRRGPRFVLVCTTLALSLHPALAATTRQVELIALFAALSGIFQAGLDLVFFDELMRTVPPQHSATFVSMAQSLTYLATFVAPLLGTLLADRVGLPGALLAAAALRLTGFALFALWAGPRATGDAAAVAERASRARK
jgi:hypothetical protein